MAKKKFLTLKELDERLKITPEEHREIREGANRIILLMRIREERKRAKLSQAQLASRAGIARPMLSNIETGNRNVTVDNLVAIARGLDKELVIDFVPRKTK